MELKCFTMEQKTLYYDFNYRQTIIRGVAGGGKSLLILMKIVDVFRVQDGDRRRVVLIAFNPFIYKCRRILRANDLTVDIIKRFPTTTNSTTTPSNSTAAPPDVLIIGLKDFFGVPSTTLLEYDIDSFDVFIDDLQSFESLGDFYERRNANFSDIAEFVDNTFMTRVNTPLYLWVCFDMLQCEFLEGYDDNAIKTFTHLNDTSPRHFNIPTFHLTKILRNSADIIPLIQGIRAHELANNPYVRTAASNNVTAGHNITCTPVVYHKISENTDALYVRAFVTQRLHEVLPHVARMIEGRSPSDVAILYRVYRQSDNFIDKSALENIVRTNFKCTIQTIKDFELHNNKDDVIFDYWHNSPSFEFEVVVAVKKCAEDHDATFHNMITRARSHLVVVDADVYKRQINTPTNMHTVFWKRDDKTGKFVRSSQSSLTRHIWYASTLRSTFGCVLM